MTTKKQPIVDVEIVRGSINRVWGQIAFDCGFVRSNAGAIELCIDADRIATSAYGTDRERAKLASAELDRAIKEHGYAKVLRSLSRSIRLL